MLATLLASIASIETAQVAKRFRRATIDYALAAIAAAIGIGFLLGAAFMAIANYFGTIATAIGFGAGFLIVALLILGFHRISSGIREKRAAERRSVEMKTLAGAAAVAALPTLLRGGIGLRTLLLPLAALAAFAIFRENRSDDLDLDDLAGDD